MMGARMFHEYKNEPIHSQFLMSTKKYKSKNSSFQTSNAFGKGREKKTINNAFNEVFPTILIMNCFSPRKQY
jgi:hypothetical protein